MEKTNKMTICQQLNIKVEEGKYFEIFDQNNNCIYTEDCTNNWAKFGFDEK